MLGWRIAISAVLIPSLIGIFYLDAHAGTQAPFLLILAELLALRSTWELTELLREDASRLRLPVLFLCAGSLVGSAWVPYLTGASDGIDLTPVALCFAIVVMLLCANRATRFDRPGGNNETLGLELLIVSYSGLLLAVTAQLRWVAGAEAGYLVLGSLLVCAKGGDIGAYTFGRLFGKMKLAPRLSPNKTRAGAVGAVLGAALLGWAWLWIATPLFNPQWRRCAMSVALLYGAVIGLAGLVGDLCESLLKRDVGRKDSAALLPGFGGLLDLLDSVIYAGPVALLLWRVLPLATWH